MSTHAEVIPVPNAFPPKKGKQSLGEINPRHVIFMMILWSCFGKPAPGNVTAATFKRDSSGNIVRWDLATPELRTGYVSTNVVNPKTRAVRFFLPADAWSQTNRNAELDAIRASFAVWQATPNSILRFEEGGTVAPGVDVNELDGTNVVFWAKTSTLVAGGTLNIMGATAVTCCAYTGGIMVGSDIVLNGVNYCWFTDVRAPPTDTRYYFVESIVTHEIGHFIGLEHSPVGGGTMFYRTMPGIGHYLGLTTDERIGVRALYPKSGLLETLGTIQGKVTADGTNVLGAAVLVEDMSGNIVASTVTTMNGNYSLSALLPGRYNVRVCPLDPPAMNPSLVRGMDVAAGYATAFTTFLPGSATNVATHAGKVTQLDFKVRVGAPSIRICGIRTASPDSMHPFPGNTVSTIRQGDTNFIIGVYSRDPLVGAALGITGSDVVLQPLGVTIVYGYNLIHAQISVSTNASPGLRSLFVSKGDEVAYANGFVEIVPAWFDDNYDGLDDMFQRRYFSLWVSPAAGPDADPDGDGFNNRYEYIAGSNPVMAGSVPTVELEDVTLTTDGTIVSWNSIPGAKYQLWTRARFAQSDAWRKVESVVTATGYRTQLLDAEAKDHIRFYVVELLPGL
ncbi:MAG: carboxypeptidase regulatory-like domain-containing protein [Verrucomicrobiae bacterium]|nr:carboxypeptidase regulatory-like domain-containing protein [Verrucomicrobiae bacterium]